MKVRPVLVDSVVALIGRADEVVTGAASAGPLSQTAGPPAVWRMPNRRAVPRQPMTASGIDKRCRRWSGSSRASTVSIPRRSGGREPGDGSPRLMS